MPFLTIGGLVGHENSGMLLQRLISLPLLRHWETFLKCHILWVQRAELEQNG